MTRMSIILNTNKLDYMQMTCYQIVVYCNVAYEATTINYIIMGRGLYVYVWHDTFFLSDMTRYMDEKPFNRVFLLVDSKVSNSNSLHALTHSNTHASHVTGLSYVTRITC